MGFLCCGLSVDLGLDDGVCELEMEMADSALQERYPIKEISNFFSFFGSFLVFIWDLEVVILDKDIYVN